MSQLQAIVALCGIAVGLSGVLSAVLSSAKAYRCLGKMEGHWEADRARLSRHSDGIRDLERVLAKLPTDVERKLQAIAGEMHEDMTTLSRVVGEMGVRVDGLAKRLDAT